MRRHLTPAPAVAALLWAAAIGGCGDAVDRPVGAAGALPAASGTLTVALPGRPPATLDPLQATDAGSELLVRQLYDPLVETLSGPYGDLRRVPGPALALRASADHTVWRLRLRPGIVFQDGSRLDSAAVLANANRWRSTTAGRALLPGLIAADSPRPDLVRFFFARAAPRLRLQLAHPQLGLVSPAAFSSPSGEGATLARPRRSGSGPFEVRQRGVRSVVLARNADWWGTSRRLGPALDTVQLDYVRAAADRARLVRSGQAEIAADLPDAIAAELHRDPLVSVRAAGAGGATALERSVRGVDFSGSTPVLSGAWLTAIGAG